MLNIYNIPLFYISFNKKPDLENSLKNIGFTNINFFKAVDGRKFDIDDLRKNNIITIRSYNDLKEKRTQHSGIPSLGSIGCTMSHYNLWKKCVDEYEYIIIIEDDININRKITEEDIDFIRENIMKENGGFISNLGFLDGNFFGAQFCIFSKGLCNELVKDAFPIDVQTDFYICHKMKMKDINIGLKSIFYQKIHISDIQDVCIKCFLPNKNYYYYIFIIILIILVLYNLKFKN